MLGCGMVDPRVLEMAGVDPNEYTGFAAGFGVERFAMVLFGVQDLRNFWNSDMRFLEQFPADIQARDTTDRYLCCSCRPASCCCGRYLLRSWWYLFRS